MIQNYLHHTSRFITDYCIENKIKNIVIGYNKKWKQEVNLGKVNNQKFVSIPYLTLIRQIQYKSEEVGIRVILNEESYTSKCDSLALEKLEKQESYLGKRIKRGLFQSSIGKLINADVSGSLNILRKVIGDGFIGNLINKSCVLQPLRMNIFTKGA
jgi:putative transposase